MELDELSQITILFERMGWEIEPGNKSLFKRFCDLIERIKDSEHRNMMIDLTGEFLRISDEKYSSQIKKIFISFLSENSFESIYILPLLSKKDSIESNIKSSYAVAYAFRGVSIKYIDELEGRSLKVIDRLNDIKNYNKNKDYILLVDDFIGTGDTALDAIEYLMEVDNINLNFDNIGILSIVCLETGFNIIENLGVPVYTCFKLKKGISDIADINKREKYISYMTILENNLKINKNERFGYKSSEALVSMIRTPNNTFPIYRYENLKKKIFAPFPRK